MVRIFLLLVFICSCSTSNLNHNRIEKDEVIFQNGVQSTNVWEGKLIFKRVSWFSGLMLSNDVLYWKVDQFSPFSQWFSADEKEHLSKCYPLIVTMMYAGDDKGFSNAMMKDELSNAGFSEISLKEFKRNIGQHPDFNAWKLSRHKLNGFCRNRKKSLRGRYVYLNIPGFTQTYLEL